jgi:Bacterial transglutaminase-like N-terminal region
MILNVEHIMTYRYDRPVRGVVQSHRLTPSLFDGQRVQSWDVTVTDGQRGGGFRDGAGDWVQAWTVLGPVSEIAVTVRGTIETFDTAGMLRGLRDSVPPEAYLRETTATRLDAGLSELAQAGQAASGPLDAAHRLSAAVTAAIAWSGARASARTMRRR